MSLVVVAEDDEDSREMLQLALQRYGHTVLLATDGEAARRLLQERAPDVVVLDLQLPLVSGLQLSQEIQAEPRWRDTPVIAISAGVPLDAVPSADLPVTVVLPKPFPMAVLLACVDAVIRDKTVEK